MGEETWELPPAEHPIGVYLGLVLSTFILGVGSVVLFLSIYSIFKNSGFNFTSEFIGRILLFFGSSYGALSSLSALYSMVSFQRTHVKKVEKEFKDFTIYARPLVEEVIRQRLVSQGITEQLEQLQRAERKGGSVTSKGVASREYETLVLVAILANITVGLYLYHDRNPWTFVPYSLMILAFGWWFVVARYFDFIRDPRSWYIPAIYILIVPSLSIILRGYLDLHQVLFIVFASLIPYILGMYTYYSSITLGQLPSFIPQRFKGSSGSQGPEDVRSHDEGNESDLDRLREFMPPKNKGE